MHVMILTERDADYLTIGQALANDSTFVLARPGGITSPDVVIVCFGAAQAANWAALAAAQEAFPRVPVVVWAARGDDAEAALAVERGAVDYLAQDTVTPPLLARVLRYARERQDLRSQLHTSQARARLLMDLLPDGVFIAPLSEDGRFGRFTDVNEAGCRQFGYSRDELLQLSLAEVTRAHEDAELQQLGQRLLAGESFVFEHVRSMWGNGKQRMEIHTQAFDLDGAPVAIALVRDITEQAQTESALRDTEQLFQQFIEHLPGTVFIYDQDDRLTYCNTRYAQTLDRQREDILGKTVTEYLPPAMVPIIKGENVRVLRDRTVMEIDYAVEQAGQLKHWLLVKFPIVREHLPLLVGGIGIDITHEKLNEAALQKAYALLEKRVLERTAEMERIKNRIEAIFNYSGDGILLLDVEHGAQQANFAFHTLFGCAPDSYFGLDMTAFVHPDDAASVRAIVNDVFTTQRVQRLETRARRQDGTHFDAEISIAPISRVDRSTTLVCIIRDISERKQAQQVIAEERNLLRTLIDAVPDYIYIKDAQHRLILNNTAHLRSLGASESSEVKGKTDFDLFPHHLAAKFHADEVNLFATGQPVLDIEERSIGQDGSEIWALTTKVPLRNLNGEVVGLVGITHDVSHLKASEEALRRSEEQYREAQQMLQQVLDTIPVRVFWKDLDSVFLGCNWLFAQDAGMRHSTHVIGRRDDDLPWLPGETARYRTDDQRVMTGGVPLLDYEEPITLANGQTRIMQTSKLPLRDANGTIIGVLGTSIDITARKEAEKMLERALMREKELGEMKSRFLSMASHEFRTPLATIMAAADLMLNYGQRMTPEAIEDRLHKIRQQVQHMTAIMEDILHIQRGQAGHIEFHPIPMNLDALCREIIEEFESQPGYRGRIRYQAAGTVVAELDPRLMRQIITNLVSNGLKYSADEQPVMVDVSGGEARIMLTVEDHGIGIPPEDVDHLFEPFHRARNVGTISGTGLGMSIIKQAVDVQGGALVVDSRVSIGTRVTVTLPTTH